VADRPNILVLMSDEHSAWASGAYGHPFIQTPNLDALAARGVAFDRAYCNSPVCAPSRAAFLTGWMPHRTGVFNNNHVLPSDIPTWAHYLSAAGYQTVLCGKQHFSGPDQTHGFEMRLGTEPQTTRIKPNSYTAKKPGKRYLIAKPGANEYTDHDLARTDEAVRFIEGEGRDPERPFALCYSIFAPHFPFEVDQRYWDMYAKAHSDLPRPLPEGYLERLHPANQSTRAFYEFDQLTEEEARQARVAYYGLTTFMDEQMGAVLAALDREGLRENTIVVYTTDHGEHLGEHGMWMKQTFFEDSVRIPLIVSWPGQFPEGERRERIVSLVDVAATIAEWGGGPPVIEMDGRSLDAVVRDASAPWVDIAFSELVDINQRIIQRHIPEAGAPKRMVCTKRYKYVYYHGGRPELYDLERDPEEWEDRWDDPAYAAVRAALEREVLTGWDPVEVERRVDSTIARTRLIMEAENTYLGLPTPAMGGR
jgi:choline-sulfatase